MGILIELVDQDYQYCLDYASGKTNTMALNNINRIIKAVADGTQYETRLKADMVAMLTELKTEIEGIEIDLPFGFEPVSKISLFMREYRKVVGLFSRKSTH